MHLQVQSWPFLLLLHYGQLDLPVQEDIFPALSVNDLEASDVDVAL
jgi:hypothetical protein